MCVTTKEYACGHQEVIIQDCLTVKNLKMVQSRNKPRGRGFFNTVFCRKQRPDGAEIICTAPAGIQSSRLPCPKCAPRPQTPENVRQIAEWKSKQRKTRDRNLVGAGVRVLDQSEIERRRLTTKWQWICSRCYAEGRIIESWHRTPNGGPCCARGADEFDAWEKREGYRSLDYDPSRFASRANRPRDLTPPPPPPPPKMRNPNLPTARPKRPTVVIPDEPRMLGLRRVSGHEDLRNHVITTPRESHWVPKIADSISNHAEPPAARRKTEKHEEILMPYLGEQFEVSFSDTLSRLSRQPTQTPSTAASACKPVACSGPSRSLRMTPVITAPLQTSRASSQSNWPKPVLPPLSQRRMTSSRGPISPTRYPEDISPLSSPFSSGSSVSPVSSAAPSVVDEMNRQINNQIDDTIEFFSSSTQSSDEEEERAERNMRYK